MTKKIRPFDILVKTIIWICGILILLMLFSIVLYVFFKGLPNISWELLSTAPSEYKGTIGILPMIINTLYIVVITVLISTPIGVCSAIYLNEYSGKNRLVRTIEFTTETLAGIPSIIYGLFGFAFFVIFLKLQYSIISGALTLTIMVLPTIIRTTQEALKSVPSIYREGALGLGSTKLYMIRTILIPSSLPGILTAVILSIGRIVGESAALIFTSGLGYALPKGLFQHINSSGATLTVQLYQYAVRGEKLEIPFAIAGVCSAIYLNEYSGKNRLVKMIEFTTETLAGIPSIIYGLFGFAFFVIFLKLQYSIISGALTLTIMVLPTIIRTTQEALKSVPSIYREGALGLGSTKLYMIRTILIPSSLPGILTAVILSIGRIVGESAALIFTSGLGYALPKGLFQHINSSGATLTVQLYQYAVRGEKLEIPFAIASILIIVVLIINLSTKAIAKKFKAV